MEIDKQLRERKMVFALCIFYHTRWDRTGWDRTGWPEYLMGCCTNCPIRVSYITLTGPYNVLDLFVYLGYFPHRQTCLNLFFFKYIMCCASG